jgi:hypothetical protein
MKKLGILLLLGAAMLEVGCGLPDSYFLQAPTVVTTAVPGNNSFAFSNPVHDYVDSGGNHVHPASSQDINVNFTGDELYYKLYGNSNVEINAYDSTSPTDPSVQLASKGFYPVVLATDSAPVSRTDPVIAIDFTLAGSGSLVTVAVNQAFAPTPQNSAFFTLATNPSVEIRRGVEDLYSGGALAGQYKSFQSGITTDPSYWGGGGTAQPQPDADFAAAYAAYTQNPTGLIYVAWYAMSFGYTTTGTPVRSTAVFLGYMYVVYP